MMESYYKTSFHVSERVTRNYSTSFYSATKLLDKEMRQAIYSIYGFVRFADEIVDTFHAFDKKYLLVKFESDFYDAMEHGISLNPVLQSFQETVRKYAIPDEHIQSFLDSMKCDLVKRDYIYKTESDQYIYGSADVVGLMCLRVFCNGNEALYKQLEFSAMKLGSAFQKVNFLRDLKNDMELLDRRYFPEMQNDRLDEHTKMLLIRDIEKDFQTAYDGIVRLPRRAKLAVLIAYFYYQRLLDKIRRTQAEKILESRIRISNITKMMLLSKAMLVYKLRLV